jgi:indole-3-glycerol phosphate synthase
MPFMYNNTIIIAEVKTCSPSGFKSNRSWDELLDIAINMDSDWIAVHVNPEFGGSLDRIREAAKRTSKTIVAKGYHDTVEESDRSFDAGASLVLVTGRIPQKYYEQKAYREKYLIEPYTLEEFLEYPDGPRFVWNSRDLLALRFGGTEAKKKEDFDTVRRRRPCAWLCQASNIKSIHDIHPRADAALIGTHLESFAASLESQHAN